MTRPQYEMTAPVPSAIPQVPQPFTPTQEALLGDLAARFAAGEGFAVATPNLDHVVKLGRDAAFRAAYARQTHVVADGNPIVWLQRLAARPVELVTGSDLIDPLMALAATMEVPVAFVGSRDAVLEAAAARLEAAHPGLRIVAKIAPPYGFDPTSAAADACLDQVGASGARLCLLAFGAPKQEMLAARGRDRLPGCGFVSIGAGLDFIAGAETRAPSLVRKLALEWLWRMVTDWRRLAGRYRDCALVLPGLTRAAWQQRGAPRP